MTYLNVSIYNENMKGGEYKMHFMKFLKGLDTEVENKGTELLISIKGDKEKLAQLEKKLGALKELCCGCCDGESEGGCC